MRTYGTVVLGGALLLAGLPEVARSADAANVVELPPANTQVYILANDNTLIAGKLLGMEQGYLVLQLTDRRMRFSPQDIRRIFLTEDAAREAMRQPDRAAEKPAEKPSDKPAEVVADKEFLDALTLAREKNAALRALPVNVQGDTILLEAQNYLLDPQALLKPKEVLPVFQGCLLAISPKQKQRADEVLRQHMKLVGSSELTHEQKLLVRSRVEKLFLLIATGSAQPARGEAGL